jgi:hypothetical protein
VRQIVWEIQRQFVREIILCVDAFFSYCTENCIRIRFAANRTLICTGNRIRVDGPSDRRTNHRREADRQRAVQIKVFNQLSQLLSPLAQYCRL